MFSTLTQHSALNTDIKLHAYKSVFVCVGGGDIAAC